MDDMMQKQILAASQKLFQQFGYPKVNMDDVAKAVGKGRSSLYYYYKSKDEIFQAVMDIEIGKTITDMTQAVAKVTGIEEKIKALFTAKLASSRKRKELYNALDTGMDSEEASRYTKARQEVHRKMVDRQKALLKEILEAGMASGALRLDKGELDTLVFLLSSSLNGLKREMTLENNFMPAEPAIGLLVRLIFKGLKG